VKSAAQRSGGNDRGPWVLGGLEPTPPARKLRPKARGKRRRGGSSPKFGSSARRRRWPVGRPMRSRFGGAPGVFGRAWGVSWATGCRPGSCRRRRAFFPRARVNCVPRAPEASISSGVWRSNHGQDVSSRKFPCGPSHECPANVSCRQLWPESMKTARVGAKQARF